MWDGGSPVVLVGPVVRGSFIYESGSNVRSLGNAETGGKVAQKSLKIDENLLEVRMEKSSWAEVLGPEVSRSHSLVTSILEGFKPQHSAGGNQVEQNGEILEFHA